MEQLTAVWHALCDGYRRDQWWQPNGHPRQNIWSTRAHTTPEAAALPTSIYMHHTPPAGQLRTIQDSMILTTEGLGHPHSSALVSESC